jgi:hypothetical protein
MSMATGEYVSVSSQADTKKAALVQEQAELNADFSREHRELAAICPLCLDFASRFRRFGREGGRSERLAQVLSAWSSGVRWQWVCHRVSARCLARPPEAPNRGDTSRKSPTGKPSGSAATACKSCVGAVNLPVAGRDGAKRCGTQKAADGLGDLGEFARLCQAGAGFLCGSTVVLLIRDFIH